RVANAIIEVQARAVQVRTVVKAFLLPGLLLRERQRVSEAVVLPPQEPPVPEPEETAGGGAGRERAPEQSVEKKVEAVAAGQR
ncbi:MAG: hypothetical protein IMW89_21110, partial [Ktedonobacteraceae bacterium]|nr:hypothetical protein [Ktedonobacteraceae bacterium]